LDLKYPETYEAETNAYLLDDIAPFVSSATGRVHVRIPSYATGAANRGIIILKSPTTSRDTHALRFTAGNRIEYLYTAFSVDAVTGLDTSVTTTTTLATPATAIAAASVVDIGFAWTETDLYVVYGSTATVVQASYQFSPYGYQADFGRTWNGATAESYFGSQAAWTWEIKFNESFVPASPSFPSTDYGSHTLDTSAALTTQMPVKATSTVRIDVPLAGSTRTPYAYLDGYPQVFVVGAIEP
jgi:hypothetical protein